MTIYVWTAITLNGIIPKREFYQVINEVASNIGTSDYHHMLSVSSNRYTVSLVTYVEDVMDYIGLNTTLTYISNDVFKIEGFRFTVYVQTNEFTSINFDHYKFLNEMSSEYPIVQSDKVLITLIDATDTLIKKYLDKIPNDGKEWVRLENLNAVIVNRLFLCELLGVPKQSIQHGDIDMANIDVELMLGSNLNAQPYDPINGLISSINKMNM